MPDSLRGLSASPLNPETGIESVLRRARELGFLGPGPISDHIEHADFFRSAVSPAGRALDLGSGGGLPGLVLALAWSQSQWVLFDASERRTKFLREAVSELDLAGRVKVIRGRAEEAGRDPILRSSFDLVTARSFAGPAVTAECGAPFLMVGGQLVVSEPPDVDQEIRWPREGLRELGLERSPETAQSVVVLIQSRTCPDKYPRRTGVPGKRPLFS